MKQKASFLFFFSTVIIIFSLLFLAGSSLNLANAKTEIKNISEKNYIESEVIVKISKGADVSFLANKHYLTATLLKTSPDGNLYILKSASGLSTKKMIRLIQDNQDILSIQPNFKYKPLARVPNDPKFPEEWPLSDTSAALGGVSAPSAWDFESARKNKVPIAVIDTGISYNNPEITGSITGGRAKGKNMNSPKKKPIDFDGHGTFLSGIIAAKTNNKKGLAGASFFGNIKIMPLKFDFTTTQAISAISYAKARSIPIINASWGGYGEDGLDLALKDAIANYAGIFVTAAGNGDENTGLGYDHDGGDPAKKMYPCDFELANILCVGASDKNGALAEYSDFGATSVDVAAPGGSDDEPIIGLGIKKGKYSYAEGSSLSTAFVTAEAGLVKSQYPNLGNSQIIEIIKNSVDAEPSLTGKVLTGGKINFQKAMQLAGSY
jgi:thermitase